MPDSADQSTPAAGGGRQFVPTCWTDIVVARESGSPEARDALERLCRTYWSPLYSFIRRKGYSNEQAQDLTQGFFCQLLERNFLGSIDRRRGKFRTFLLSSLTYFLANEYDYRTAQKRGGGQIAISLDDTEQAVEMDLPSDVKPELLFDRQWAMTLVKQAKAALKEEYEKGGRGELFEQLEDFLKEDTAAGDYEAMAKRLNMTPGAITTAVHRLRQRYGKLIEAEISRTVGSDSDVESERRYLFRVLGRS